MLQLHESNFYLGKTKMSALFPLLLDAYELEENQNICCVQDALLEIGWVSRYNGIGALTGLLPIRDMTDVEAHGLFSVIAGHVKPGSSLVFRDQEAFKEYTWTFDGTVATRS